MQAGAIKVVLRLRIVLRECNVMKKILAVIWVVTVLFSITACGNDSETVRNKSDAAGPNISTADSTASDGPAEAQSETRTEPPVTEEESDMLKIEITVGDKTFHAALYDNEAAEALTDMLPLTLDMSELNGNEKYYYLDSSLPANASRPSGIKAGDIMLYGNSCLVLFYESFSTSYSYTPIGYIDDPSGLAAALGSGSVQVTFKK